MSHIVRRSIPGSQTAWLSLYSQGSPVPDHEPGDPVYNTDKSKAVPFHIGLVADAWALDTGGVVEDI